jgi:hypothetical protein
MRAVAAALIAVVALAFAAPAWTKDKDDNPGQGKGRGGGGPPGQQGGGPPGQQGGGPPGQVGKGQGQGTVVVADRDRSTVYSYYRTEYAAGNCPPGLAKKNNGCLPPGQAKKMWTLGYPLGAGIAWYPLPAVLLGQLTPAPAGYQYARVGSDILLLAIGTGMVAAAIADLGSMP